MAMELIGASGMTPQLKQTYDKILLSTAEKNLQFVNYGRVKDIPARGGKSIEFRRFERITVGTHVLTEGTPPTETQVTYSTVAATISQYGAYTKVSDVLQLQAFDPVLEDLSRGYGEHVSEVLDTVARDVIIGGTTVQYASTAGSRSQIGSGMYLNSAELTEAKRTIRRESAKPIVDNKYICFIHPDNTKDLFDDTTIVDAFKDAAPRDAKNNPLFSGVLGDWMGIRFVETENLKIQSSLGLSGADVYQVMLVGKEAYGITRLAAQQAKMIVHPLGSGGHTDPLEQYSTVGWKAAFTCVRLNESWMCRIECNASYATAA